LLIRAIWNGQPGDRGQTEAQKRVGTAAVTKTFACSILFIHTIQRAYFIWCVWVSFFTTGKFWRAEGNFIVWYQTQEVANAIEPGLALVVGIDDVPGRKVGIGCGYHLVIGLCVVPPPPHRLDVHGAEFPLFAGIGDARAESPLLLVLTDIQKVLD